MLNQCRKENERPSGSIPGRIKAQKHKTGASWPLRWVIKETATLQMARIPRLWEQTMHECFLHSVWGPHGRECQPKAFSKGLAREAPAETVYQEPTEGVTCHSSSIALCSIFGHVHLFYFDNEIVSVWRTVLGLKAIIHSMYLMVMIVNAVY